MNQSRRRLATWALILGCAVVVVLAATVVTADTSVSESGGVRLRTGTVLRGSDLENIRLSSGTLKTDSSGCVTMVGPEDHEVFTLVAPNGSQLMDSGTISGPGFGPYRTGSVVELQGGNLLSSTSSLARAIAAACDRNAIFVFWAAGNG